MLGVVLIRRDFREYDQIISVYTKEAGKVEALARGVKKITSKNTGSLEPFSIVEIEIVSGKEINHVTKAQALHSFKNIRENLAKILMAQYVVALVDRLVGTGERDEELFLVLQSWLQFVNETANPKSLLIPAFTLRLLSRLGFKPELEYCIHCKRAIAENNTTYYFDVASGGLVGPECQAHYVERIQQLIPLIYRVITGLRSCMSNSWPQLNEFNLSMPDESTLNTIVYNFAVYHSGHKVPDWRNAGKP